MMGRHAKALFALGAIVLFLTSLSCKSEGPETVAKVELSGGLQYSEEGPLYIVSGNLRNTGTAEARLVRMYVTLKDGTGRVLDQAWAFSDIPDIDPGAGGMYRFIFLILNTGSRM